MAASKTLTPQQRRLRSSAGGYASWANTEDRRARTKPGTDAFLARFDGAADPVAARRAYMQKLAYKASRARQAKKANQ